MNPTPGATDRQAAGGADRRASVPGFAEGPPRPPPPSGGRRKALALALVMHGLLLGLLVFGLNWQFRTPDPIQAELWVPPPVPTPAPRPDPQPRPQPPAVAEPPAVAPAPPRVEPPPAPPPEDPQIKAEQVRREAERKEAERRLAEQREAERKEAERKLAERKETERKEAERKEAERKLAEQREAERREAERKLAERKEAERKEAERKRAEQKADEERRRRDEQAKKDEAAAEARRADDIRRLQSQAGSAGIPSDTAVRGAASGGRTDGGYAARVAGAIRANTTFQVPADLEGNPKAVFAVQLRADCTVVSVRLRKSSGVPAWDQAAERGIQRTDPFPRPADGSCQSELEIVRGPRDER